MTEVYKIVRSVTVSKAVEGVYMTHEQGLVQVYKNGRRVVKFQARDFKDFLSKLKAPL